MTSIKDIKTKAITNVKTHIYTQSDKFVSDFSTKLDNFYDVVNDLTKEYYQYTKGYINDIIAQNNPKELTYDFVDTINNLNSYYHKELYSILRENDFPRDIKFSISKFLDNLNSDIYIDMDNFLSKICYNFDDLDPYFKENYLDIRKSMTIFEELVYQIKGYNVEDYATNNLMIEFSESEEIPLIGTDSQLY